MFILKVLEVAEQECFVLKDFTAEAVFFGFNVQKRAALFKNFTGDYFECGVKQCSVKGSRYFCFISGFILR